MPFAEEIAQQLETLREQRQAVRRQRPALDGTSDALNANLTKLVEERGGLNATLADTRSRLKLDLQRLPDVERPVRLSRAEATVTSARDDHRAKAAALEAQRQKSPSSDDLERRRLRVQRLEEGLENQRSQQDDLDREIANFEGQLQSAGGDGIGETVEALREERSLASRKAERLQHHVASLKRAGKRQQVIVFTRRSRAFVGLGAGNSRSRHPTSMFATAF